MVELIRKIPKSIKDEKHFVAIEQKLMHFDTKKKEITINKQQTTRDS